MEIEKTRPCAQCLRATAQKLRPTKTGAAWTCTVCDTVGTSYTFDDMKRLLSAASAPMPARAPATAPESSPRAARAPRVFIEGANAAEVELDPQFVQKHLELIGELPKVGGSVYTSLPGVPGRLGAIPYGKVTRIE